MHKRPLPTVALARWALFSCLLSSQSAALASEESSLRLKTAIERRFSASEFARAAVSIHVEMGIVTLTGLLPSDDLRRALVDASKSLYGVRGIIDLMTLQGAEEHAIPEDASEDDSDASDEASIPESPSHILSDEQIARNLGDVLSLDPRVQRRTISLSVDDGEVTLRGNVPTQAAAEAAYEDARNTPGVINVESEIAVASDRASSGRALIRRLRQVWQNTPGIDTSRIIIMASATGLELHGTVPSPHQKLQIEKIASAQLGKRKLISNLRTAAPSSSGTYGLVPTALLDRLAWEANINVRRVRVGVSGKTVSLAGYVLSEQQRLQAEKIARSAGAKRVINRLRVGQPPPSRKSWKQQPKTTPPRQVRSKSQKK